MRLLALETAGEACSVAVSDGDALHTRVSGTPRTHAARILGMVDACLAEAELALAELDAVAFGRGPGSFTGVRIATAVAQGLAAGAGLPLVPVSSLAGHAAAAARVLDATRVAVCVDARMGECYFGCFEVDTDGQARLVGDERLAPPGALALPSTGPWLACGSGWSRYPELAERLAAGLAGRAAELRGEARDLMGSARGLLARGEAVAAEEALPVYLRDEVAWTGGGQSGGGR